MAVKMGIREFRDRFTSLAREATEPVIVTNHNKVVGWFTPARRAKPDPKRLKAASDRLDRIRMQLEESGFDIDARFKALAAENEEYRGLEEPAAPAFRLKRKRKRK